MVAAHISKSNGATIRIVVDPDPKKVAKDIGRLVNKPMSKQVGKLHKRLADDPAQEIKKRADSMGSGRVRIGRAVRGSAAASALTVIGGKASIPDFAGQEWGSKQYRRFLPWKGSGDESGYVIGPMMRDDTYMTSLMEKYADGMAELIEPIFNGRG